MSASTFAVPDNVLMSQQSVLVFFKEFPPIASLKCACSRSINRPFNGFLLYKKWKKNGLPVPVAFCFFVSCLFRSSPFHSISARAHKLHTAHAHCLLSCLFLRTRLHFLVSTPSSSAIKLTPGTTTRRNAR